jgi:two-component system phosphate regulon sensor histidine kinase PhoR
MLIKVNGDDLRNLKRVFLITMQKLRTARILMALSVFVITCFQVYWLVTLYKDNYKNIIKTTDVIFRETLYTLQVERFKNDSLFNGLPGDNLFTVDMVNVLRERIDDTGSVSQKKKSIFISIDNRADSFHKKDLQMRDSIIHDSMLVRKSGRNLSFMRSLKDSAELFDSIPLLILSSSYRHALSQSNIDLPFEIFKIDMEHDSSKCITAFCTGIVPLGIFGIIGYKAAFEKPAFFLFKSIGWQIILSLLLIVLIVISFLFIYKNLVAQQRLSEIKNEFISNITHELKTPIATVNVAIEALRNFGGIDNPERAKKYLDISASELERLSLLVDKVLKNSMFENKSIPLQKEKFDLVELVKDVMSSMNLQFEKQNATTELKLTGNNFVIDADKLHMTSVVYNLLDNALKYSKENPHIVVQIEDRSKYIELSVKDNGTGIPGEYKRKIFEKFFRVPGGDRHNIKGYGLGLSYVHHIVAMHQGFIEVQSELGKGSDFIIKLPFEEAPVIYYNKGRVIRKIKI